MYSAAIQATTLRTPTYKPIVIWHGMGDTCCNAEQGTGKFVEYLKERLPHVYIKSIATGESEDEDQKSTYMGNINAQLTTVCEELAQDDNLKGGFNAIGFSQCGLFLRAYVERCNTPPVHRLITFGSLHAGTADIPRCKDGGFWCSVARGIARRSAYGDWAQTSVVQAGYYKDVDQLDTYLEKSQFLPDINNERPHKLPEYAQRMASLERLVLVQFENDTMVVPKETAWFGFYNGSDTSTVLRLHQQDMYKQDWLGLKLLDLQGRIEFLSAPGEHMQFSMEYFDTHILAHLNTTAHTAVPVVERLAAT